MVDILKVYLAAAANSAMKNFDYKSAIFLAERLLAELSDCAAENDRIEVVQLLARAHMLNGAYHRAYELLKMHPSNPTSSFLMAQCWYVFPWSFFPFPCFFSNDKPCLITYLLSFFQFLRYPSRINQRH